MISSILLSLNLLVIPASPYTHDGALLDGDFGQRLDYFCRSHASQDPEGWIKLQPLLEQFDENFPTVSDMMRYVPDDAYLSNYLNWVSKSNLASARKLTIYRTAYEKCIAQPAWNKSLDRILSQTDALTINEILEHIDSKDKYVRFAAEGAMKRLREREKPARGKYEPGDLRQIASPDELSTPTGRDEEQTFPTDVFWGLATSILLVIAAVTWWLVHRQSLRRRGQ